MYLVFIFASAPLRVAAYGAGLQQSEEDGEAAPWTVRKCFNGATFTLTPSDNRVPNAAPVLVFGVWETPEFQERNHDDAQRAFFVP